jgi:hypothetical protein
MTWREPEGEGQVFTGDIIGRQYYFERRIKPNDPTKEQIRKRRLDITEYRGYTLSAAEQFVQNSPLSQAGFVTTKSFYAIGGGGYNMINNTDAIVGDWEDMPEYDS